MHQNCGRAQIFPTANALQGFNKGGQDAFVAKLSSSGSALAYSTYLGGSTGSTGLPESGYGIAVTPAAEAVVVGTTRSSDFPKFVPLRASLAGTGNDAFALKLNAAGSQFIFSTYLGGSGVDAAKSVALDGSGTIYVAGETTSKDMQIVNAVQATNAGLYNAFLTSLSPDGRQLRFESYWGGSATESAAAVAVDNAGNPVIAGLATSWNFPLKSPLQTFNGSNYGGFIARVSMSSTQPQAGIGIYSSGHWTFSNNLDFWFGVPDDIPVVGDWNGSGRLKIGVYRKGQWFLDYNGSYGWDGESVDRMIWFGLPGDIPVVGDWDGSGRLKIGVYRNGQWLVDLNGNLQWDGEGKDAIYSFGSPGAIPIAAKF